MATKLVERLQALAPCLVPLPAGELFAVYWTRLVQAAGVDLWAKASLAPQEQLRPEIVRIADDLSLTECLQVALYLELEMNRFCGKIDAEILRREATK